jgi:hypothetical protein
MTIRYAVVAIRVLFPRRHDYDTSGFANLETCGVSSMSKL